MTERPGRLQPQPPDRAGWVLSDQSAGIQPMFRTTYQRRLPSLPTFGLTLPGSVIVPMLRDDAEFTLRTLKTYDLRIASDLLRDLATRPTLDDELLAALIDIAPSTAEVQRWDEDGWPDRDGLLALGALRRPNETDEPAT